MTEEQRGKAFPIHVEMGDDGPVLDLGERGDAINLPDRGCVLVDYEKQEDGTLRIKTVCMQAESSDDEDDAQYSDMEDALNHGEPKEEDDE